MVSGSKKSKGGRRGPRGRLLTLIEAQAECEKLLQTIERGPANTPTRYPWAYHKLLQLWCHLFTRAESKSQCSGITLEDYSTFNVSVFNSALFLAGSPVRIYLLTRNSDGLRKHWLAWQQGYEPKSPPVSAEPSDQPDPASGVPGRVNGTAAEITSGAFASRAAGGPTGWLSSARTIILGIDKKGKHCNAKTQAVWNVPVARQHFTGNSCAFLVFGCLRVFGGLHSAKPRARVKMWVNNRQIDEFELKAKPANHNDYFYRPALPRALEDEPSFNHFATVYAWPLADDVLDKAETFQKVTVRITGGTSWDIDEVAIHVIRHRESMSQ